MVRVYAAFTVWRAALQHMYEKNTIKEKLARNRIIVRVEILVSNYAYKIEVQNKQSIFILMCCTINFFSKFLKMC